MSVEVDTMKHVAEEDLAPAPPKLRVADRCDAGACGAQAYVVTMHTTEQRTLPLLWCAHHFTEHEDALAPQVVVDNRDDLTKRPSEVHA